MKKTKFVILLISILFPLIVTTFIAFYSYGAVGGWTKNQEKFLDRYFSSDKDTLVQIEDYVKFYSSQYKRNDTNLSLRDRPTENEYQLTNGVLTLENNFSLVSYATLYRDETGDSIQYQFYIFDINYDNVDPANLYLVPVPVLDETHDDDIESAIKEIQTKLDNSENAFATATAAVKHSGTNAIFDNNYKDTDEDEDEKAEHYVYSFIPTRTYEFTSYEFEGDKEIEGGEIASLPFNRSQEVKLILVEKLEDNNFKVWFEGQISNLKSSTTSDNESNFNTLTNLNEGFEKNLLKAGYLSYVWPTLLWQSAIAFAITGVLSYLFYKIWTMEVEEDSKLKPRKR